jgi:hypothetical protein
VILAALVTEQSRRPGKNELKSYLTLARVEVGNRLLRIVYSDGKTADKSWICFVNRKFMDKDLQSQTFANVFATFFVGWYRRVRWRSSEKAKLRLNTLTDRRVHTLIH